MNLSEQTKQLCKLYNITPARSRGQNFLINENIYDKIIKAAELTKDDVVLEVGPGLGFLTAKLAIGANGRSPVQKVIAVELDKKLVEILKVRLAEQNIKNVEVVNEDILNYKIPNPKFPACAEASAGRQIPNKFKIQNSNNQNTIHDTQYSIPNSKYKVVANLPYNITSIFLRKFFSAEIKPESMVLMLQKEVAKRITAKPLKMSLLAVSVQFYAKPEIVEIVPRNNFWPEPEVDSAIIKIIPHSPPLNLPLSKGEKQRGSVVVDKEKDFFRLVKIGFSAKRKMLKNNLAAGLRISQAEAENKLKMAGFNEKIRAQELSMEDWLKLFGEIDEFMV